MSNETELAINPETGRDSKGRFAKGNRCYSKNPAPRAITSAIRAAAADNKVTEESLKFLLSVVKNKDNKATVSEQIKAAQFLMNQFTISAEKDADKEIAEEGNKAIGAMFEALKEMQK